MHLFIQNNMNEKINLNKTLIYIPYPCLILFLIQPDHEWFMIDVKIFSTKLELEWLRLWNQLIQAFNIKKLTKQKHNGNCFDASICLIMETNTSFDRNQELLNSRIVFCESPKDLRPGCHSLQSLLNSAMGRVGGVWREGTMVNMCRWSPMTVQQAKRKKNPLLLLSIFSCGGEQRGDGLHTLICSKTGDGRGGWARRSFMKDRNIYRNLHSRLLSAAWGAQDRHHRCQLDK